MDAEGENGLIAAAHRGVIDPAGWKPFAAALRQTMGAVHANLTLRRTDAPMSELTSFASGGDEEEISQFYFGGFHREDPLPYYRLGAGQVFSLAELFGPGEEVGMARMQGLLDHLGAKHLLIVRITETHGANAWLTVMADDPGFSSRDREVLGRLALHLGIALETYVQLADAHSRLAAYAGAMDRLNVGLVTLAADGQIIDADPLASRLMVAGEVMSRDPRGRLVLQNGGAARTLAAALRDFAREAAGRPRALRLGDAAGADMLLLPVTERPATGRHTPVLRAYVHCDLQSAGDSLESLAEMFRLTASEARLALALGKGNTLAEAAQMMGITLQSARTYSKRIFQKTGTRRQAELVRLLLTSTLSLA